MRQVCPISQGGGAKTTSAVTWTEISLSGDGSETDIGGSLCTNDKALLPRRRMVRFVGTR